MRKPKDYSGIVEHFVNHPKMHHWEQRQLRVFYRVSDGTIRNHLLPAIGRLPLEEERKQKIDAMMADPDFGKTNQRAPCSHKELAKRHGLSSYTVIKRRERAGVRPFSKQYDKEFFSDDPRRSKSYRAEREAYKMCRLARSWGRSKGMKKYQEFKHEQKRKDHH